MSEPARAVLLAGGIGVLILLGPLALLAAGLISAGAMIAIQVLALGAIYLAAVAIRSRRERDPR